MDLSILNLLGDRDPALARDFLLAWAEHREASWTNAARDARARAASVKHEPHIRGQLRYQYGESALAVASRKSGIGCLPMPTKLPGGVFMLARVGRFGLVSLSTRHKDFLPRRTATRKLLSEPNDGIDPQTRLELEEEGASRSATELAYFGCLVSVPNRRDPTAPSELAFAVPDASLERWIEWAPLHRVCALLQSLKVPHPKPRGVGTKRIPDRAIPKFRVPKKDRKAGDDEKGA